MKEKIIKKQEDNRMVEYPVSLSKYLAACGVASRRKSTDLIKSGQVAVNGNIVNEPGMKLVKNDQVEVDGKRISLEEKVYIMLNKPRGYVCTSSDPFASKKAIDLVQVDGIRLFTVGRLDKDSEGLILLTNDGEFANMITHPKHGIKKRYLVTVDLSINNREQERLCDGIIDDGEQLRALRIEGRGSNIYEFVMGEGKKREIRRLVKSCGKKVIRLQRVAIGGLKINDLKIGNWKFLSSDERKLCFNI